MDNINLKNEETKLNFADRSKQRVEAVKNPVLRFFTRIVFYFLVVFYDLAMSIKRSPMLGAALLIASPGIFIGFFLDVQIVACDYLMTEGTTHAQLMIFILILLSTINIFNAVSVNKKKNLGTVIITTLTTLCITIAGAVYISTFFVEQSNDPDFTFNGDVIKSIICIVISLVLSISGTVMSYFYRDKNYVKERL